MRRFGIGIIALLIALVRRTNSVALGGVTKRMNVTGGRNVLWKGETGTEASSSACSLSYSVEELVQPVRLRRHERRVLQ